MVVFLIGENPSRLNQPESIPTRVPDYVLWEDFFA